MTKPLNDTAVCGLSDLPRYAGCTLAIGNFDGVHRGHQALLSRARAQGRPLVVLSFEPHPRQYFAARKGAAAEAFRLYDAAAKARLLQAAGADHVILLRFDDALAGLSADDFIRRVIVDGIGAAHVVVGADFAFGRGRGGDLASLQAAGAALGFTVEGVTPVCDAGGQVYSSSRVRTALAAGDFAAAAALLGRPWQIEGAVVHGDRRGRELGYPTANMRLDHLLRPPYGIYAVRVELAGEEAVYGGVANLGVRPMFAVPEPLLETFIFDFSREIYGKTLRVIPLKHLRPEAKFDSLDALIQQMKQDCLEAMAVLKSHSL